MPSYQICCCFYRFPHKYTRFTAVFVPNHIKSRKRRHGDTSEPDVFKTNPQAISISNKAPTPTIQPANLIADTVARSVVRNSLNKVTRNQNLNIKAANISQKNWMMQ